MKSERDKLADKIMKHARSGLPCIRCGKQDGTVCGRHYNGIRQHQYGKGRGIKCSPLVVADFCNECDGDFQEGSVCKSNPTARDIYSEEFQHWTIMSLIRRQEQGII